ncbi:MAG: hypothetical protein K0U45_00520 [Alphaproteobacteria bacterium]|nr:hypothetical protein [Alphaproteobacteria bacterium]
MKKMKKTLAPIVSIYAIGLALAISPLATANAQEAESQFDIGFRGGVSLADSVPANDIPYYGLLLRYAPSVPTAGKYWAFGLKFDAQILDYEEPHKRAGITQDYTVSSAADSKTTSNNIILFLERETVKADKANRFMRFGLGTASPETPPTMGTDINGNEFTMVTDAGTETIIQFDAGVKKEISDRMSFETAFELTHHFADWKVMETQQENSPPARSINDYSTYGISLTLTYHM